MPSVSLVIAAVRDQKIKQWILLESGQNIKVITELKKYTYAYFAKLRW